MKAGRRLAGQPRPRGVGGGGVGGGARLGLLSDCMVRVLLQRSVWVRAQLGDAGDTLRVSAPPGVMRGSWRRSAHGPAGWASPHAPFQPEILRFSPRGSCDPTPLSGSRGYLILGSHTKADTGSTQPSGTASPWTSRGEGMEENTRENKLLPVSHSHGILKRRRKVDNVKLILEIIFRNYITT